MHHYYFESISMYIVVFDLLLACIYRSKIRSLSRSLALLTHNRPRSIELMCSVSLQFSANNRSFVRSSSHSKAKRKKKNNRRILCARKFNSFLNVCAKLNSFVRNNHRQVKASFAFVCALDCVCQCQFQWQNDSTEKRNFWRILQVARMSKGHHQCNDTRLCS